MALILSRKEGESFLIGDNIVVSVQSIRGDRVRIGIEAPKETDVHRLEVWKAIQAARLAAAKEEIGEP